MAFPPDLEPDWFFHREAEIERAVAAYQRAVVAVDDDHGELVVAAPEISIPAAAPNGRTESCPITTHRDGIDDYTDYELVEVVRWIESDTLLRTEEELPRGDDASARLRAPRQEDHRRDRERDRPRAKPRLP